MRFLFSCLFVSFSCYATAGMIEYPEVMMPPQPLPPCAIWQGIYFGVDAAYDSLWTKTNTVSQLIAPGGTMISTTTLKKTFDAFGPTATLGFWYAYTARWLYGIKAAYQWLNVTSTDNNFAATLPASFPFNQALDTLIVKQSAMLLLMAAHPFETWLAYIGFGPIAYTAQHQLQTVTFTMSNMVSNNTTYRTLWGGAAQVGFNMLIPGHWAVDLNYTVAMTTRYTYPSVTIVGIASPTFTWSEYYITQIVTVGLNKLISI